MQLITLRPESIYYAFGKCLDFMSSNAVKWNCGSISVYYLVISRAIHKIKTS